MSNNDVNSANPQYDSSDALFGFPTAGIKSTGLHGSSPSGEPAPASTVQPGQLGEGLPGGFSVSSHDVTQTGAPAGHAGPTPPHDGGSVAVTDFYANLGSSQAPQEHGTANTNAEAMEVPGSFGGGQGWGPVDHDGRNEGSDFPADSTGAAHGHVRRETP